MLNTKPKRLSTSLKRAVKGTKGRDLTRTSNPTLPVDQPQPARTSLTPARESPTPLAQQLEFSGRESRAKAYDDNLAVDASGEVFVDFDEKPDKVIDNAANQPDDKPERPELDLGAEASVSKGDREEGEVRDEPRPKRQSVASTRGPRTAFEQKLATSLELTNPRLRQMISFARCYRRTGPGGPKPEGKDEQAMDMTMVMSALAERESPARNAIVRDIIDAFPWFIFPREEVEPLPDEDEGSVSPQRGNARSVDDSRMASDDEEEVERPLRRSPARSDNK